MGINENSKILITGLLSERSIAYGIAKALRRQGARLAFTYQNEAIKTRVEKLAHEFDAELILPCDVSSDEQIQALFDSLSLHWPKLDGIVHAIAFAPRDALSGSFHESVTRENFRIAHDISAYSLAALVKAGLPLLNRGTASVVALSYLGAVRAVPNYNVMGLAKASLESCIRYLAFSLGPLGIRVNGISAGPVKTLASSGIANFNQLSDFFEKNTPLGRMVNIEEIGDVASFLCSGMSSSLNGEIVYADGGFHMSGFRLSANAST
jgi:enoyl-[acyl-carrier protein] reductase I